MAIDWAAKYGGTSSGSSGSWAGSYGGGGSGAGVDWAKLYGGTSGGGNFIVQGGAAPKKKSDGGILGDIERFVEKTPGSNIAANVVGAGVGAGEGVVQGLYGLGRMALKDTWNHPLSLLTGPLAPLTADVISHAEGGHGTHLENEFAVPLAKYYSHKYAPIFEHPLTGKSYKGIEDDPFGTFLDLATVATIPFTAGASAALKVGSFSLDASRIVALNKIASLATKAERTAALAADAAETGKAATAIERAYIVAKANRMPLIRTVK